MAEIMLWNKDKTESVKASKIGCFGIYPEYPVLGGDKKYKVLGWFDSDRYFYFGNWDTKEEAGAYLETLHKQIEGRV